MVAIVRVLRPGTPALTTTSRAALGPGRFAVVALGMLFAASATTTTASSAADSAPAVQPAGAEVAKSTLTEDEPEVRTIRLKPRPKPGAFSMNLYSRGDFMHQQTTYWCVPASAQTMMNIIDDG